MEVKAGRRDIYARVPAIWFISCISLLNQQKTVQPSSCTITRHFLNEEPRDGI